MKDEQAIRDEVYEKCIRKAEQKSLYWQSSGGFKYARAIQELILSLKSMRHAEHEARKRNESVA